MFGIITYDCPHQKTLEIIERCSKNIDLILTIPFKERPRREVLINHRPLQITGPSPKEIGRAFSIDTLPLNELNLKDKFKVGELIVGGAGIIKSSIVKKFKVINSHPGLIPLTRGLDSFKWAIYYQETLGITIHQINEEVDMGLVIHHSKTNIFASDNIQDLAIRHYRNEINCLCNYINGNLAQTKIEKLEKKKSRMRMSFEKEAQLINKFNLYKKLVLG